VVRIVLADDHLTVRRTVRICIESDPDLEVVAEAGSGREAIDQVDRTRPDMVILDYQMPGLDGLEAARVIAERHPDVTMLMLTGEEDTALRAASTRVGVKGLLLKGQPLDDLLTEIHSYTSTNGKAVVDMTEMERVRSVERP
jgi:DNA-binding NarL/FixJ family response regulator